MTNEIKETKKKEEKVMKTIVVEQLPTQPVNKALDENGNEFSLMTRDEAITELLEGVRKLVKSLT